MTADIIAARAIAQRTVGAVDTPVHSRIQGAASVIPCIQECGILSGCLAERAILPEPGMLMIESIAVWPS